MNRQCSTFSSMSADSNGSKVEGHPAIFVQDSANDLLLFLKALYDGM
jgi:hypothetical protein